MLLLFLNTEEKRKASTGIWEKSGASKVNNQILWNGVSIFLLEFAG